MPYSNAPCRSSIRRASRRLARAAGVLLAGTLALGFSSTVQAAAGKFQFVYGEVSVTGSNGQARSVRRGSVVQEGDIITTTRRGSAQLKMADGAALAVRPRSAVRIDAYQYQNQPKKDRSFLSLLRGTLRSITGLIGRNNRGGYRVSTRTATIGIRGSDADIGFNPETGLTAVRTYAGGHSITSNDPQFAAGVLQTNAGQIALVRPGQAPAFAERFPFATPTPQATRPAQDNARERRRATANRRQQLARADAQNQRRAQNQQASSETTAVTSAAMAPIPKGSFPLSAPKIAPFGTAVAGGVLIDNAFPDSGSAVANSKNTIILGADRRPLAVASVDPITGDGFRLLTNSSTTLVGPTRGFQVRNANDVVVSSGRWGAYGANFRVFDDGSELTPAGNFHFAIASNATPIPNVQTLGQTTFSFSFPQLHVNISNEAGSFSSDAMVTNFSGNSSGNLMIAVQANTFPGGGSNNYSISGTDNIMKFLTNDGIVLSGNANAKAKGRFVGKAAQGVIMVINGSRAGGAGISGTAVGFRN